VNEVIRLSKKLIVGRIKRKIQRISSTHYYTRRSSTLLLVQNTLRFWAFLRSDKPSRTQLEGLKRFHNFGKGRVALVLGNGPSLDLLNIREVERLSIDVFAVNSFCNLQISRDLIPKFYCLSDPMSFSDGETEMPQMPKYLLEYLNSNNITTFVPHIFENAIGITAPLVLFDDRERTLFSRNISPLKPRAYISATSYKALALACFMKYEKIYILGFDNTEFHEYHGSIDNTIIESYKGVAKLKKSEKYSYLGGEEIGEKLLKKFPSVYVSGMAGRLQSYAHLFGDLRLFKQNNIVNLDQYSLTDAFKKEKENSLIQTAEE
jgi:hypothetical protein